MHSNKSESTRLDVRRYKLRCTYLDYISDTVISSGLQSYYLIGIFFSTITLHIIYIACRRQKHAARVSHSNDNSQVKFKEQTGTANVILVFLSHDCYSCDVMCSYLYTLNTYQKPLSFF